MAQYRICRNSAPHVSLPWWTVEKSTRSFFGRPVWRTVQEWIRSGLHIDRTFCSEDEAQAWVDEDNKPRTHDCGPVQ